MRILNVKLVDNTGQSYPGITSVKQLQDTMAMLKEHGLVVTQMITMTSDGFEIMRNEDERS